MGDLSTPHTVSPPVCRSSVVDFTQVIKRRRTEGERHVPRRNDHHPVIYMIRLREGWGSGEKGGGADGVALLMNSDCLLISSSQLL